MKKLFAALLITFLLAGCGAKDSGGYTSIDAETAMEMMDGTEEVLILDVREREEYDEGHIPNAILFPVGSITKESAPQVIPDPDTTVLVYCRSGNRSKTASQTLADLGYTSVYEFGGIRDWPYEIEVLSE